MKKLVHNIFVGFLIFANLLFMGAIICNNKKDVLIANILSTMIAQIRNLNNELLEQASLLNQYVKVGDKFSISLYKNIKELEQKIKDVDYDTILRSNVVVASFLGAGSGTVIKKTDKAMYVLTCWHVIDNIIELEKIGVKLGAVVGYIKYNDSKEQIGKMLYGAAIIKYDKDVDLALLKINFVDEYLQEIKLASEIPNKGDTLYSIGNPLNQAGTISKGILANYAKGQYIFDGVTTFGNSGGGLYNVDGELVGVPNQVFCYGKKETIPESSLGFAIDLSTIKKFLDGVEY
jgi:S1-C subfamily serine protease